jgi:hypothetical protein
MRSNYWSCSKFADWVRGVPRLTCGTSQEWNDWEKECKKRHPLRYRLAEGLGNLQDFVMWPLDKLYSIKYWLINRFITKTHALTSNLKRGSWYEMDDRIINCLFDELVNFVEVEKAWKNIVFSEREVKKYNAPWYATGWFRFRNWRSPEAGADYLDWESTLIMDESWGYHKDNPDYGKKSSQAETAETISKLYHWWKFERPNRKEPHELSGWSEICRKRDESDKGVFGSHDETDEECAESKKAIELATRIEEEYHAEDTQMLIDLIQIRRSLWT